MNHAAALDRARPSRWEFPAVFAVAFGLLYVFLIDDGWIDQYTFLRFGQRVAEVLRRRCCCSSCCCLP